MLLLVALTLRPCKAAEEGMLPKTTVSNTGPPVYLVTASSTSRSTVLCKEERLMSTACWMTGNIWVASAWMVLVMDPLAVEGVAPL